MPPPGPPAVPSRNALRVLRRLALAGSTVGSFCTVAAITYDVNRRVSVAERIVENKRAIQSSAPRYDATSAARRLSRMMEAAEAGEFQSVGAWMEEERKAKRLSRLETESDADRDLNGSSSNSPGGSTRQPVIVRPYANNRSSMEVIEFLNEIRGRPPKPLQLDNDQLPASKPSPFSVDSIYSSRLDEYFIARETKSGSTTVTEGSKIEYVTGEDDPFCNRMRELFDKEKYIDAAQTFLDTYPASIKGISSERREIVLQAFYLNCKHDNVFLAKSIFERLEMVDRVSPTMWRVLIFSLAKKGCIESAATLYLRYKQKFALPGILLDVVLRCLIESRRLSSAKSLLTRNLFLDRDCGLCAAYLNALWKKTRSLEVLNTQFTKLLIMLRRLDKKVTPKIFNPVLRAYIEIGRSSDAEALVHDMTAAYGIQPICWTKGYLVLGKALQCDWAAVDEGFEEMHELGLTKQKNDFVQVFDRVFLEYWPTHTSHEIRDYIYRYIDRFDIVPDQCLYRHMIEAFIEKDDESMITELMDMALQQRWPVQINHDEFIQILYRRRSALKDSPVGIWRMLIAAREENRRATASQRLIGHDRYSLDEKIKRIEASVEGAKFPEHWYERTLEETTEPTKGIDTYQELHKVMIHFMHAGNMTEALARFHGARDHGKHLSPIEVELALIGTLIEHGLEAAQTLIQEEWADMLPIFFRQIKSLKPSSEAEILKMAIFRFYQLCWTRSTLRIKHHIVTSTSHRLIASDRPELAIDLLVSAYKSKYGRLVPFDGVCMKMFMRAFAAKNNLYGMRWCILTAIARGSALNADFVIEAERLLAVARRDVEIQGMDRKQRIRKLYQLERLDLAVTALRARSSGAPEFAELRSNSKLKKLFRKDLKGRSSWKAVWAPELPHLVERWDEEYELERVLGRIEEVGFTKDSPILERWNEITCRGQEELDEDLVVDDHPDAWV